MPGKKYIYKSNINKTVIKLMTSTNYGIINNSINSINFFLDIYPASAVIVAVSIQRSASLGLI